MPRPPAVGGVNGSSLAVGGGGPPQLGGLFAGGMPKLKHRSGGLDTGGILLIVFCQVRNELGCGVVMEELLAFSLPSILMHTSRWRKTNLLSLRQKTFLLMDLAKRQG